MKCEDAQELITGLVDDELSDWERSSIESHLKDCSRCRWNYEQETALKKAVHMAGQSVNPPDDLRVKILTDPHALPGTVDPSESRQPWSWPMAVFWRPAFALAAVLILALPVYYLMRPTQTDVPSVALETHEKIRRGDIVITRAGSEEELKKQLTSMAGGRFSPLRYDLSNMDMKAIGGIVEEAGGRRILVTVYDGNARLVTCYTFIGTEKDAPAQATLFIDPTTKMNYYTFSRGALNAVLHREGNVICILVSEMPSQELLALARPRAYAS
jgi:anti-sigma factor RsiW